MPERGAPHLRALSHFLAASALMPPQPEYSPPEKVRQASARELLGSISSVPTELATEHHAVLAAAQAAVVRSCEHYVGPLGWERINATLPVPASAPAERDVPSPTAAPACPADRATSRPVVSSADD